MQTASVSINLFWPCCECCAPLVNSPQSLRFASRELHIFTRWPVPLRSALLAVAAGVGGWLPGRRAPHLSHWSRARPLSMTTECCSSAPGSWWAGSTPSCCRWSSRVGARPPPPPAAATQAHSQPQHCTRAPNRHKGLYLLVQTTQGLKVVLPGTTPPPPPQARWWCWSGQPLTLSAGRMGTRSPRPSS